MILTTDRPTATRTSCRQFFGIVRKSQFMEHDGYGTQIDDGFLGFFRKIMRRISMTVCRPCGRSESDSVTLALNADFARETARRPRLPRYTVVS